MNKEVTKFLLLEVIDLSLLNLPKVKAFHFYYPNIAMVITDVILYFRNKKLEQNSETIIIS